MAVKNKGGNWLPGESPENALERLLTPTIVGDTPAQRAVKLEKLLNDEPSLNAFETDMLNRHLGEYKASASVDNWISNTLAKYMRNEMATPDDPVRVMASQWPAQQSEKLAAQQAKIDALVAKVENYRTGPLPEGVRDPAAWRATRVGTTQLELNDARKALDSLGYREPLHYTPSQYEMNKDPYRRQRIARRNAGFPEEGVAPMGSAERWWENAADYNINARTAAEILDHEAPLGTELPNWMFKIPPETSVYSMHDRDFTPDNLAFDHLVDELRNSTNIETDLPPALRLDPTKLDKITVPQMVEHVANINAYRAEQAAAANFAKSTNAAVQVVKDYPDTNLGWRQIRMPEGETDTTALQEALKYEGDAMGHSVGGYARKGGYGHGGLDAILDGRAQVFSLRDAKGQPHVTIEIGKANQTYNDLLQHLGGDEDLVETFMIRGHQARNAAGDSDTKSPLGHALELAGVPERYQITQVKGKGNGMPADKYLPAIQDFVRSGNYEVTRDLQNTGLVKIETDSDLAKSLRQKGIAVPTYVTQEELTDLSKQAQVGLYGFAAGGPVNLEQLAARYADGGDVEEDNWLEKVMSLDTPEMTLGETAADIAAGFAPGVGSAMSLRDFERARRDNDYLGMALSGIGVIPVVGGVARGVNKARKAGLDELYQAYTAADRANAGRRAAELISSQEPVKASEALGQLMERGFRNTTTTQADRTRVGGGNIGGAPFSAISEVDPGYAGKVWGVMDEGTASRLTNLTTPETAWTTMLGSSTQLKTNPIVFDKLKRAFVDSMKKGNLSDELAAKINHNLALDFGEGVDIRDPKIWQLADTFDKRAALANAMMGQGIAPKKGGVALGGELRGGAIFNPSQILIRETERALLHPKHGGNVPTFAAGPRAFSLDKATEYRPDLHPGFPTLIQGRDLGVNMIPTPTEVYLPDWHRAFKTANPDRKAPGYYDLALGVKDQGLPSQALNDEYIRHLIREGFAEGGEVSLDELNDKYLPPMSNAELLAQIDRSMANSPAPAYGTASSAPRDSVQTDSRNMLRRLSDAFGQNVTAPVTGAAMDMTAGVGDLLQMVAKAGAEKLGIETKPFTPVSSAIQESLGVAGYDPYSPAALAASVLLPAAGPLRAAGAATRPMMSMAVPGSAKETLSRLAPILDREASVAASAELAAMGARELAPDNVTAEIAAAIAGGGAYNTLDNILGSASRGPTTSSMAADDLAALTAKAPLDMSQAARMQRAAEQGFDTSRPLYHSTNASFDAFEIPENRFRKYGKGVYTSPNPNYVDRYIRENRDIESGYKEGANVMPLYARGKIASEKDWEAARQEMMSEGVAPAGYNPQQKEIQRRLKEKGFDGLNMFGNEIIIFDPSNIRSANAAFDPAKRGSGNLGYAQGGTVRAYDPQQIENIMSSINAPRNYASGGSVLAYNPGRVDAILNQFRGAV
jgi:hypothetical protein